MKSLGRERERERKGGVTVSGQIHGLLSQRPSCSPAEMTAGPDIIRCTQPNYKIALLKLKASLLHTHSSFKGESEDYVCILDETDAFTPF